MSKIHELTRRQICRAAFLIACLLPTTAVLAWGVTRRLPGRVAAHATELERATGLHVTLGNVTYPRPGATLYHDLVLADPETDAEMLRCRVLEAASDGQQWLLRASQVEVEAAQAPQLWETVERQLRQAPRDDNLPVRAVAWELTWHGPGGAQTITDLAARLMSTETDRRAELSFQLAGESNAEPVVVRATRRRGEQPSTTNITLDTSNSFLPANIFGPLVDAGGWLGGHARFRGKLSIDARRAGWEGELTGQLDQIDLDALVTAHFPHTLSGTAELRVDHARLRGGRLVEAAVGITAGPGVVSRSLVASVADTLHLAASAPLLAEPMLNFEQMAFEVTIDGDGMRFLGVAPAEARGAMLVDVPRPGVRRALWLQPEQQPQPVVAVLRALVPQSEMQVPANPESEWLIRHLPVPPLVAPAEATARPPTVHLRGPR
ncbi:MAG TPA: hypothetical protein VHZ24_14445 [Pirellulales bacterium]|jgi:hypothetical protein|nr:hypothetical protein [Pirellulales bacterium]